MSFKYFLSEKSKSVALKCIQWPDEADHASLVGCAFSVRETAPILQRTHENDGGNQKQEDKGRGGIECPSYSGVGEDSSSVVFRQ